MSAEVAVLTIPSEIHMSIYGKLVALHSYVIMHIINDIDLILTTSKVVLLSIAYRLSRIPGLSEFV